ncbi:MAG: hypothetical protein V4692_01620, partial [Bdellovibrionota bacterium]
MSARLILFTTLCLILSACAPAQKPTIQVSASERIFKIEDDSSEENEGQLQTPEVRKQAYEIIAQQLNTVFLTCPAKIWPDYSWKNMNVVFAEKESQSYVWRGSTGRIEPIAKEKIPVSAFASYYDFFELDGEKTVSIFSKDDAHEMFNWITHEGFHNHGQAEWKRLGGTRGTAYPPQAKPRLYRRMMFDRMKEYFESENPNPQ